MNHRVSLSPRRSSRTYASSARASLVLAAASLALGCGNSDDAAAPPAGDPYASWAASPQAYDEPVPFPGAPAPVPEVFDDRSVRQVARLSAGGSQLRIRLSNLFGNQPLDVQAAGVALSAGGATIEPTSHVALTFGGAPGVSVPAGQELWSDYVSFTTEAEASVAVTLYLPGREPAATVHSLGQQATFVANADLVTAATFPADADQSATGPRLSYYWLSGVDVRGDVPDDVPRRVVVAFGDSITDGFGSTVGANTRYPNILSERMTAPSAPGAFSVVNAGISGNRVIYDVIGPAGATRFERDVLGQTGVTDVVILLGINDIGFAGIVPEQEVPVNAITGALSALVELAAASGVRAHLGTLLPLQGTMAPYYGEAAEAKRQAVNAAIRANTRATSVIDFDAVMADPANPLALQPALDSGDHLHPNDAGYAAMANAIDLAVFE